MANDILHILQIPNNCFPVNISTYIYLGSMSDEKLAINRKVPTVRSTRLKVVENW